MKSLENLSSEDLWSEILRQHQFRESHYKIVGHIVVQFSAMEMILSSLVAQIVNRDNFVPALMACRGPKPFPRQGQNVSPMQGQNDSPTGAIMFPPVGPK